MASDPAMLAPAVIERHRAGNWFCAEGGTLQQIDRLGTPSPPSPLSDRVTIVRPSTGERFPMNNLIWLVGAVVIVLAILSFFGFR